MQYNTLPYFLLRHCPLIIFMGFISHRLSAQTKISGSIADSKRQSLATATIFLKQAGSKQVIKQSISQPNGAFEFESVNPGTYFLEIFLMNYDSLRSAAFTVEKNVPQKSMGIFTLKEDNRKLKEVTVVAKKQVFEQKIDRFVINVSASITSAGSTALEVLERAPGVVVSRQDNSIALAGKSGVVVMINGRMNYMTPEAAIQMLNGMSASSIDKIELLSTPPANMDAEGNAGYINIVLKKNENEGLNGSYAATIGYGKSPTGQGETGNASINLNYRKKKWYVFGDYSYLRFGQSTELIEERSVLINGNKLHTSSITHFMPNENNQNGRIGFDYQLAKKVTVGGLFSGYNNINLWDLGTETTFLPANAPDTFITTQTEQRDLWQHLGGNLNLQYTIKENESISVNADYLYYNNSNPVNYIYDWNDKGNTWSKNQLVRTNKETPIRIAVGKVDYLKSISTKVKMETGIKFVASQFNNNILLETYDGTNWIKDDELTANYTLKEAIAAAFASFETKLSKKTTAKAGLRYEYTSSNLSTVTEANIVDRNYGLLFPSIFLSHNLTEKSALAFSYSRRITRPNFNQLAPFIVFSDPYTFFAGNPALQPAISDNYKADYRYKSSLFTFQYSHEDSSILRFQSRVQPGTNRTYNISENLKGQNIISLTVGSNIKLKRWWNFYFNTAGYWQQVKAYNNGYLNTFTRYSVTFSGTQTFTLPKNYSVELIGNYNSGKQSGIFLQQPFGALNAGIQKKFAKNNSRLSLGFDNILNTLIYRNTAELPEQNIAFSRIWQWSQPTAKISWTSNFGNQQMKAAAKKMNGADEERSRVN